MDSTVHAKHDFRKHEYMCIDDTIVFVIQIQNFTSAKLTSAKLTQTFNKTQLFTK